jgi:hypothetical protein
MLRAELAPNKFPVSFHSVAGNATSRCAPASAYHSISRVRINHLQFRSVAGFVIMENSQIFTSLLLPSSILQHYVNIQPVFHNAACRRKSSVAAVFGIQFEPSYFWIVVVSYNCREVFLRPLVPSIRIFISNPHCLSSNWEMSLLSSFWSITLLSCHE